MGCDIHSFCEIKRSDSFLNWLRGKYRWFANIVDFIIYGKKIPYHINGKWEKVGNIFKCPYFNPDKPISEYNNEYTDQVYQNRNYGLFSILADVRNYNGIKPIKMPVGLPGDLSEEVNFAVLEYGSDGHSHSYYILKELLEFDWAGNLTFRTGITSLQEYNRVKPGRPSEYSRGISGPGIKIIEMEQADNIEVIPDDVRYYVNYKWTESYKDIAGENFFKSLDQISKLGDSDNVRFVFFFDN